MNEFDDLFSIYRLSVEKMRMLSYRSVLGTSLKNYLSHFGKDELINELIDMTNFYNETEVIDTIDAEYRVKSLDSIKLKYDRYFPEKQVNKVFNDILGFRVLVSDYTKYIALSSENLSVADMSKGKANDDGYRGVHIYFQNDNFHYPIEIQINTYIDRQFNDWLHSYIYKQNYDNMIGIELRKKFDEGLIPNEEKFEEKFNNVLHSSKKKI